MSLSKPLYINIMATAKLQINLFICKHAGRVDRTPITLRMIDEIMKSKYVNQMCLHIYYTDKAARSTFEDFFKIKDTPLMVTLIELNSVDYTEKVNLAHKSESEFSCKLDDDILMSQYVWDYAFESLDNLTDNNPVMAPIFTNGIPSADLFVQDFLDVSKIQEAHEIFLTEPVADAEWGLDFTGANNKIRSMSTWNEREYWDAMETIDTKWNTNGSPWFYSIVRGVHPARYSKVYNMFIANEVINNKEKFFKKHEYRLETFKAPYFCNNLFFSKTDFWRESYKLFHDGWDEGQLTAQMNSTNAMPFYIRNGFAIHMAYGLTRGQQEIEAYYIQHFTN